jgi:hypothetical protein
MLLLFLALGVEQTKAPVAVYRDNTYVARRTTNTENGNEEVMFRASTLVVRHLTISLSNSSGADSWRVEIAAEGADVAVTWWETNQTSATLLPE